MKKIQVQLPDETLVEVSVPNNANDDDVQREVDLGRYTVVNQASTQDSSMQTNLDPRIYELSQQIGDRFGYDPSNVQSDFGKGSLSLARGGLLFGESFVDPIRDLYNLGLEKITGKPQEQMFPDFGDLRQAIYQPKPDDVLATQIMEGAGSVIPGLGLGGLINLGTRGATRLYNTGKPYLDRALNTGMEKVRNIGQNVKSFFSDYPGTNVTLSAGIPAIDKTVSDVADPTAGFLASNLFGLLGGNIGQRAEDFISNLFKRRELEQQGLSLPPNALQDTSGRVDFDKAQKVIDENVAFYTNRANNEYNKRAFNAVALPNNKAQEALQGILNKIIDPSINREGITGKEAYTDAVRMIEDKLNFYKANPDLTLSFKELEIEKDRLQNILDNNPKLTKIADGINELDNVFFDDRFTPRIAQENLKSARQYYQSKSFMKQIDDIATNIKYAPQGTNLTGAQLKNKLKQEIKKKFLGTSQTAKNNKRFLTAEQKQMLEDIMNAKDPYGVFTDKLKNIKDIKLTDQITAGSALSGLGLYSGFTPLLGLIPPMIDRARAMASKRADSLNMKQSIDQLSTLIDPNYIPGDYRSSLLGLRAPTMGSLFKGNIATIDDEELRNQRP